jgi:hypothetical protein
VHDGVEAVEQQDLGEEHRRHVVEDPGEVRTNIGGCRIRQSGQACDRGAP